MYSDEFINSLLNTNQVKKAVIEDLVNYDFKGDKNALDGFTAVDVIDVEFKAGISFRNISFPNEIRFRDCKFGRESIIEFIDISCSRISFFDCSFESFAELRNIEANYGSFNSCSAESEIYLLDCKIQRFDFRFDLKFNVDALSINSPEMKYARVFTNNGKMNEFTCMAVGNLTLQGNFNHVRLWNTQFEEIVIGRESNEIITSINELKYADRSFAGTLTVQNVDIGKLKLENLNSNNGKIKLIATTINCAEMSNCSLHGFEWNLVKFKTLRLVRCNLDGLKLFNVFWPANHSLSPDLMKKKVWWFYRIIKQFKQDLKAPFSSEELNELRFQRDTYRQLKGVSSANNNEIEALTFYKNEMRLYWKEMRVIGGLSVFDHFLIFLNRNASNFGQSYIRPLVGMLLFHLLFCVAIWANESDKWCVDGTFCNNDFYRGLAEYLTWLNPIYKVPEKWTSASVIFGFCTRIINGFFLYHFIRAIRKYGKS